ncbi:MAG: SPFH/Band 7/PHB domain protein, partial [Pseudonocardiales bacterium]
QQMRADRNKRAIILTAEGQRESAIKTAEGQKAAQILGAEGQKQAAILAAEAERQSRILRAEGDRAARYLTAQGQAKAVETTFAAIHAARPDPALLAYQYLQTLPQIAQGDANKVWVIPSEFSKALEGLAKLGGAEGADGPSWMQATGPDVSASATPSLDASTWFDSNLPPAHLQPEAANLRASDNDPESLEAHEGLADGELPITPPPALDAEYSAEPTPDLPPDAQRYGPAQEYGSPPPQYGAAPQQYGAAPQQYDAAPQQYDAAPQQYDAPPQQYGAPPQQPPSAPQPPQAPRPPQQ